MRKVLLDTNALRYLDQIINQRSVPDKIMGKRFDNEKFLEFVLQSEYVLLSSESLFELFLQSYWNTQNIEQFCVTYQSILSRIGKSRLRIINSRELYFDLEKLSKSIKESTVIRIEDYISPRISHEHQLMMELCWLIICTISDTIFELIEDKCIVDVNEANVNYIKSDISNNVRDLYSRYYNKTIDNKQFQSKLDELLKEWITNRLVTILDIIIICNPNRAIPKEIIEIEKTSSGATYCKSFFSNLSKYYNNASKIFNQELDRNIQLRNPRLQGVPLSYMKVICKNFLVGRKIQKNDIVDCSILTVLDEKTVSLNQTGFDFDFQDINLITFDKFLYKFSKDNDYGFVEDFYNSFLFELE